MCAWPIPMTANRARTEITLKNDPRLMGAVAAVVSHAGHRTGLSSHAREAFSSAAVESTKQTFAIVEEGGRKNVAIHLTVENFADRVQVTIEHSGSTLPMAGLATLVKSTQSGADDGLGKALEKTGVDRIEHETRDGKAYTILTKYVDGKIPKS